MQANYVQRLRLIFSKGGAARYISHLDLARTLERALNRAKIPVAYTQGFNRRPRMQMATALPLGYTSEYELADILLAERMEPEQARQQLMAKMAPGIVVLQVADVPVSGPSLQAMTQSSPMWLRRWTLLILRNYRPKLPQFWQQTSWKGCGSGEEKRRCMIYGR